MNNGAKLHRVTVVGFEQAYASAITGALDLFALAGVTWQRMQGHQPAPQFQVQLASVGGKPIDCINHITLNAHVALEEVRQTDLLLVPTIGGQVEAVLQRNRALLHHIETHYVAGADIASNCSGAFLLAEAGILKGKVATTHWGYADLFRQRYPDVLLQPEKLITQTEGVYCSGGGMAWFDLALLLIERYCGHDVATNTAKAHVLDIARGTQAAYAQIRPRKYHQDEDILNAQSWMENHYAERVDMRSLATRCNLSQRTFIRRFKRATDQTPLNYLQAIRIEAAKKLLEASNYAVEQVITQVGYDDLSSFTRLFKSRTGLSPSQYRKKFKR